MSIQLPVHYMDGDNRCIKRGTVVGGYTNVTKTDEQLIEDVLADLEFGRKFSESRRQEFPDIRRFWILMGGRIIDHRI